MALAEEEAEMVEPHVGRQMVLQLQSQCINQRQSNLLKTPRQMEQNQLRLQLRLQHLSLLAQEEPWLTCSNQNQLQHLHLHQCGKLHQNTLWRLLQLQLLRHQRSHSSLLGPGQSLQNGRRMPHLRHQPFHQPGLLRH